MKVKSAKGILNDFLSFAKSSRMLSDKTKGNYAYFSNCVNVAIDLLTIVNVDNLKAIQVYNFIHENHGLYTANHSIVVARRAWNIQKKLYQKDLDNPWTNVELHQLPARQVVWTEKDIEMFMTTCADHTNWEPVGGLVFTAYHTAQRLTDMTMLKWSNINFDERSITIVQNKTKTEVWVPMSDDLYDFLETWHLPVDVPSDLVFPNALTGSKFSPSSLSNYVSRIRARAGLGSHLQARDMRRTAVTQMLDCGATDGEIRSITGHLSPDSLRPYLVLHNRGPNQAAVNAIKKRRK